MYFTKGIKQNGHILCRECGMKKDKHPIYTYMCNMTSQCDDIILLIQDYIKSDIYTVGGYKDTFTDLKNNNKCIKHNIPDSCQGRVISIGCGAHYSIALLNDNTIECWSNSYPNDTDDYYDSLYYINLSQYDYYDYPEYFFQDSIQGKVVSIDCGSAFSCALLNDMTVVCWGYNFDGQRNVPDSIQGKVVSISCGYSHSCALLNDNTIKCWGNNNFGQCNPPESIQGKIVSIKCGVFYTCAFLNDNTVKFWGSNDEGQCDVPDSIQGKIISISCGYKTTCALIKQ
jgi:alpha-tubulin suppressor-like RCC1 family protein